MRYSLKELLIRKRKKYIKKEMILKNLENKIIIFTCFMKRYFINYMHE